MGLGSNEFVHLGSRGRSSANGVWTAKLEVHPNPNYLAKAYRNVGRNALKSFKPALLRCATLLATKVRFAAITRGATTGKPWEALTERYRQQKRRKVGTKADGYFNDKLLAELSSVNSGVKVLSDKVLEYGSDKGAHAIVWNFGAKQITRSVPAHSVESPSGLRFSRKGYTTRAYAYGQRATLWLTRDTREECSAILHEFATEALKDHGLEVEK